MRTTVVFSKTYNTLALVEANSGAIPSDWFTVSIETGSGTKIVPLSDLVFVRRL